MTNKDVIFESGDCDSDVRDRAEMMENAIKLTPVIEFGPELFRKENRDYPAIGLEGEAYKKARNDFWYAMLADWGISDLKPYAQGSEFVTLPDISDQTLEILIDRELADCEAIAEIDPDEVSTFYGGIVFEQGSHVIEPSCCGNLSNFSEWVDLARSPIGEVKEVWIGHPWIDVEAVDRDNLRLSMRCEHSSELLEEAIINQAELLQNIEKTRQELSVFYERVKGVLRRKSYPAILADALTGWDYKEIR